MSDEVSQFLEQVEKLRGQQIEEDEVRAKELEDYLAAKRERQARREERARSISPQKSSPANTPSPRSNRRSIQRSSDALRLESPQPTSESRDASVDPEADPDTMSFDVASKENQSPLDSDTKRNSASQRGSPLAWQRRPTSQGGSRPLSMVAAQNATQRSLAGTQEPASATETSFNKDQIAQALGSKDPSWFRQTADPGRGSAAYRKHQVEEEDRLDMTSLRNQLPGMSKETARDRQISNEPLPAASTPQKLPTTTQLNPPGLDGSNDPETPAESTASPTGRTSPQRSRSPTKSMGMGGFVQSAMMKRTDSVKRWSVTSPPGLTRADSVATTRTAYDRSSVLGPRTPSVLRETSAASTPGSSRPTSSHGLPPPQAEQDVSRKTTPPTLDTSISDTTAMASSEEIERGRLPTSPSKTMDPRRWSPTKSSWLESALNKPESPKPQSRTGTPSQPAWMAELQKQKTGGDGMRGNTPSHRHQVSIGGLMRSSPMGVGAKQNTTGLGGIYSPPPGGNRPLPGHSINLSISKNPSPEPEPTEQFAPPQSQSSASEAVTTTPTTEETDTPTKRSAMTSPPTTKPKPSITSTNDFRANLRQRQAEKPAGGADEPEFKSVFGNLKRTKTQNYKAPDVLKDNITRGKAALNTTGGPQKTERVDEFKEAILKKRGDFQKVQAEGAGVKRNTASAADQPIPEGIARRKTLGKRDAPPNLADIMTTPKKAEPPKPSPKPTRISSNPISPPAKAAEEDGLKRVATEPAAAAAEPEPKARPLPTLQKETSAPSRLQGRVGNSKLADRFNPALAGMLARGPPPAASPSGRQATSDSAPNTQAATSTATEPSAPGPQLTHMTKGRARGPKRRAPTSAAPVASHPVASEDKELKEEAPTPAPAARRSEPVEAPYTPAPLNLRSKPSNVSEAAEAKPAEEPKSGFSIQQQVAARAAARGKAAPPSPGPKSPELKSPQAKSPEPKEAPAQIRPFAPRRLPSQPEKPTERQPSPIRPHKTGGNGEASQPGSPKKLDLKRMSQFLDGGSDAPKPETPSRLTHQRTGSRSPVKLADRGYQASAPSSPAKVDREHAESVSDAASKFGGAVTKSPPIKPKPTTFERPSPSATPSRLNGPRALPVLPAEAPAKPQTSASPITSPLKSPAAATAKSPEENADLFADFFGPQTQERKPYKVDAAEILMNRPKADVKVRSSRVQMYQLSENGKKTPVAGSFSRVLFEQEMYVVAHEFENQAGRQCFQVYFWVGDEVSSSAAEDAQLFATKEARALGGRLVKMKQGKETSEFVQALGGVVIVQRGASARYDQLKPMMLCGRRYGGEVVFDEIDYSSAGLCSGFPYLISKGGQCYLWKGKGCDVDELSCAKLVGMELSLMGEYQEIEDGSEPDSFWELFEGGADAQKPTSADHWRLKPNYAKYGSRLFCSDADSRQQIYEISPFHQPDLSPHSIYILDAFFEIYIIIGSSSHSQYPSFRNALDFAQEYAILASSMEDRPFVPVSTIVLEGIPRDMKSVFRKWSSEKSPTVTVKQPERGSGLKRARSLKVMGLNQALRSFE